MRNNLELDQLASIFFKEFSRSEYALKVAGFHNGDGNAVANWTKFSKQVEALILAPDSKQLSGAIDFIFDQPPKKQMICNGQIQWSDAPPGQSLKTGNLLIYVRRVRNNLFHGSKFNDDWFEPERSKQLIKNCLVILNACINNLDSTREVYRG